MKKFAKIMAVVLVAAMALAVLVACGPASDPDKAKAALEANGYTAVNLPTGGIAGVKAIVSGTKGLLSGNAQTITIYYFNDADAANDAWEEIKQKSDSEGKDKSDWVIAKSGTMIYYGTSQAVKDAR